MEFSGKRSILRLALLTRNAGKSQTDKYLTFLIFKIYPMLCAGFSISLWVRKKLFACAGLKSLLFSIPFIHD